MGHRMKTRKSKIALIGERDPAKKAHLGIEASLALYRREVDPHLEYNWVNSAAITSESVDSLFGDTTGIWCTPGSPYESAAGAIRAIALARTGHKAFLGTC